MYVKSIVLDGFKSYGQRTEISGFDPQFNAITGLNGSGKSNILDSICFVLGISNLSHVRASSLQDLIYKSGQAGVNKATVSITFDNRNPSQSPIGYDNFQEIVITRQIIMGGKNRYLINGTNVPNKKIHDLFCSIGLNVNNPHFLIMQGRITKVLNMKPAEILAMLEEAAGTRMYEVKRQASQKILDKKDAKLAEFTSVLLEEVSPKVEKFRQERTQLFEFQRVERELEHMMALYQVWQYFEAKRHLAKSEKALEAGEEKVKAIEEQIDQNKATVAQIEDEIQLMTSNSKSEAAEQLKTLELQLKEKEKEEAKVNASIKSMKENINTEEKKLKQLEKNITNDEKSLQTKEAELNKVKSLFETLKDNDIKDSEVLTLAEKKYEALCAGMEVNEDGEAETLAEQLMNAKEEAAKAKTESMQINMKLNFCQTQLKEKQKDLGSQSIPDYNKDMENLKKMEKDVQVLENNLKKLNFSEEHFNRLQSKRQQLQHEIRSLQERIDNFEAHKPYTQFRYRDPESNFNRNRVKGVVCRLFQCKNPIYSTALETAAGGKLYNVVTDTDTTSKSLLQRGNLQQRTTFIPLNKISARKIDNNTVGFAQDLVGKENCQAALSLITYDSHLSAAMEFVFGNVFICKDINIAKRVTFHDRVRKKCVTLEGDSTDPSGTLSGGARMKGASLLLQLNEIQQYEEQLRIKEQELTQIHQELRNLNNVQEQHNTLKNKFDISCHELQLLRQRLQNTTHHIQQEEVNKLKTEIVEMQEKLKNFKDVENKAIKRARDLEVKMKDVTGYREKRLKEAEAEMKKLQQKAEKSKKEWRQKEQDYETLNLEISELKKAIEVSKQDLHKLEENIKQLQIEYEHFIGGTSEVKETIRVLQEEVKQTKAVIAEQNKEVQKKNAKKEQIIAQNNELELDIKKQTHTIKDLKDATKNSRHREQELAKKVKVDNTYMRQAEELGQKEAIDLERRIKIAQEKKHKLGRTVNKQAQSMFELEEKRHTDIVKKQNIIQQDRNRLIDCIADLDEKKKNTLKLAYEQVSKDFGSIFSTLLPGANAKLLPPAGKTILEGLEVKVSLGNVWKESLTELSGGQRSLAALSLILAMLLFKPAPLYILDEVDAALDLSHTQNIGNMLKSHFKKSQFIIVSLKDGMFNNANVLYRTKFIDGVSTVQRTVNKL